MIRPVEIFGVVLHTFGQADGGDALAIPADLTHDLGGGAVDVQAALLARPRVVKRLAVDFGDGLVRGLWVVPAHLHVQVSDGVRTPTDRLAHGLRAFNQESSGAFALRLGLQTGDLAHAIGVRIAQYLIVHRHTAHCTRRRLSGCGGYLTWRRLPDVACENPLTRRAPPLHTRVLPFYKLVTLDET